MDQSSFRSEPTENPVLEILARVWQTKLRSVDLLEEWIPKATDFEVKAGLTSHLADERRNLRLLSDEIRVRGGRQAATTLDQILNKPFAIVLTQPDDLSRVAAFHHGIKAYTAIHCGRLMSFVDPGLARVLEQVMRDEERHLRWADIRLARMRLGNSGRHHDAVVRRIEEAMEAVWAKPWRRLTLTRMHGTSRTG
jgi:1,2-phenylacetyl-CoA epoxidase catalytic subunit